MEVKPILEVLIGKTVEQSLLEVAEEEELWELRRQQQIQMEIFNAELAEVERLEERNRRYRFFAKNNFTILYLFLKFE